MTAQLATTVIRTGGLPLHAGAMRALTTRGIRRIINVSGMRLQDIHSRARLSHFDIEESRDFPDVFSTGTPAQPHEQHSDKAYQNAAGIGERRAYIAAVRNLQADLLAGVPIYLCCHRGIGRAPAVALSAIERSMGLTVEQVWPHLSRHNPQARLTDITLSAITWARRQQ